MKKTFWIILHSISVLLFIAGLSILYLGSPYGYGVSWISDERYEDSAKFSAQVDEDIEKLLNYTRLADAFETEGSLDMDNIVVDTERNGEYISYTLRELISTAQKYGYYFNPTTHDVTTVSSGTVPADDGSLRISYKYYDPDYFDDLPYGPGQGVTTLKDLAMEVVNELSEYYDFKDNYISKPCNLSFYIRYTGEFGDQRYYTNTSTPLKKLQSTQKYILVNGSDADADTNIDPVPEKALTFLSLIPNDDDDAAGNYLFVSVNTAFPYDDAYKTAAEDFSSDLFMAYVAIFLLIAGVLLAVITFIPLIRFDLSRPKGDIMLTASDKLPFGIYIILSVVAYALFVFVCDKTALRVAHVLFPMDQWVYWRRILHAVLLYGISVNLFTDMLRRYRAGILWSGSLTAGLIRSLNDYISHAKLSLVLILTYGSFVLINVAGAALFMYFCLSDSSSTVNELAATAILVLLGVADIIVFSALFSKAKSEKRIEKAIDSLSSGEIDHMIPLDELKGRELITAQKINHISTGLRDAINEQVKSERLKADLITNVSHDIKTPLTSIINYVDLIKREHIDNERVNAYIEVLDNKSKRLKTLTEDLVEASKASSGNLKLEITSIDFVELVLQTNAEFEDKFFMRRLELVCNVPDEPAIIEADGRRLWRVLENLYNNAAKYALEGTRVYVDIIREEDTVSFTIKNVSASKLNISPDELTERFVRGDVSRTTEGSGLGLSIAQSLTRLQGGEFIIEIDGDLYKAIVRFPVKKEDAENSDTPEEPDSSTEVIEND